MVTKKEILGAFIPNKVTSPQANSQFQGGVGFDNPRENIDPHIKTRAIHTKEINISGATVAGHVLTADANGTGTWQVATGGSNAFGTIVVAGQSNVVADQTNDSLTLASGQGIALTTNATTDTVTIASDLQIDELGNPSGDKTFSMANKQIVFSYTAPNPSDGAFEIEATGAFTGDLFHLHQHTGNPGATDLAHFEATDADVTGLRITANASAEALHVAQGKIRIVTGAGANKVLTSDASGYATWVAPASGGATYREMTLLPEGAVLDDTNPPGLTIAESTGTGTPRFRVANFDASTDEIIYFTFVVPSDMTSGNWALDVYWYSTATSGSAIWEAKLSATTAGDADDMLEQAAGTTNYASGATDTNEATRLNKTTITLSNLDSVAAGDLVTMVFNRDANGTNGTDDLAVDASLVALHLKIPRA